MDAKQGHIRGANSQRALVRFTASPQSDVPNRDAPNRWPFPQHHLQRHSATERTKGTGSAAVFSGAAEEEEARALRLWRTPSGKILPRKTFMNSMYFDTD